jgi:hypothetical protein
VLYMVECSFTDPAREADWNRYYSGPKLDSVLAVPGFRTSQRFRATDGGRCPYLAIHTVASPQVMSGTNYRSGGGGSFGEWQPYITDWARNLFDGCDVAPDIALRERLLVSDQPRDALDTGDLPVIWLASVGLDRSTSQRALLRVPADRLATLPTAVKAGFRVYEPMMPRRSEPAGKPATIA